MGKRTKKSFASSGFSPNHEKSDAEKQLNSKSDIPILRYGIGFDVHKEKIAVCVSGQITTGEIIILKEHVFKACPKGILEIAAFLKKYEPVACYLMECTGVYHLPLYHELERIYPERKDVIIAMNPLLIHRRISELGNKTDRVDARALSTLAFYELLLKPSYIGSEEYFRKRDLIRAYHRGIKKVTAAKNQIHRLLHSINFKMTLDLSSNWTLDMLDALSRSSDDFRTFYDKYLDQFRINDIPCKVLEKHVEEMNEYGDIKFSSADQFSLHMLLKTLTLEAYMAISYLKEGEQYLINDPEYHRLYKKLLSIPGLGPVGSITVLLESGDYRRFKQWESFARFCGVVPMIDKSGKHETIGHVNRYSNKYLRYILTQAAGVIINRVDRTYDLGAFAYKQFRQRHIPFKKACLKVAQKLSRIIFQIFSGDIDYDPYFELNLKKALSRQRRFKRKGTYIESNRTRILRTQINDFLGENYDLLNHSSRFLLTTGFKRTIEKSLSGKTNNTNVKKK